MRLRIHKIKKFMKTNCTKKKLIEKNIMGKK